MSETTRLSALGIDPASLTEEQRGVFNALSDEEINVLTTVKHRLDTVDGDVHGHSDGTTDDVGGLIY